jgi:hypothetical protein
MKPVNFNKHYKVNRMLQEKDFTVFHHPPYHCDLNLTELIWGILKWKISTKNVRSVSRMSLKEMTRNDVKVSQYRKNGLIDAIM